MLKLNTQLRINGEINHPKVLELVKNCLNNIVLCKKVDIFGCTIFLRGG